MFMRGYMGMRSTNTYVYACLYKYMILCVFVSYRKNWRETEKMRVRWFLVTLQILHKMIKVLMFKIFSFVKCKIRILRSSPFWKTKQQNNVNFILQNNNFLEARLNDKRKVVKTRRTKELQSNCGRKKLFSI